MATFEQVQAQNFSLAGGGAVLGATQIILQSFKTIDGDNIVMADFGSIGYGTLEPGSGILEEQVSFTGVTQNTNGTATLTGVKSVLFIYPYTETSGLAKTHAGSTSFVISNTSGFYNHFPKKENDETITGQWTFTNTPIVPGSVSDASTTVKGIAKISVAPVLASNPISIGDNDPRVNSYAADTGAANAYVITLGSAPGAYATGQLYSFKAAHANTTTSTLAVNGLAAKTIKLPNTGNLPANSILAGQIVVVEYDGTNFQMISPPALYATDVQTFNSSGTWTKPTVNGAKMARIQVWGGGGGGATDTGGATTGGGGGGGGYSELTILLASLGATETVTVGGAAAADNQGANNTFGSWVTGYGAGPGVSSSTGTQRGGGGGGPAGSGGSANPGTSAGRGGDPGNPVAGNGGASLPGLYGGGGGDAANDGGTAYYGGGGGAGSGTHLGGASVFGGAGGNTGAAGTAAGGGGGAQKDDGTGAPGAGGAGRVIVTVY